MELIFDVQKAECHASTSWWLLLLDVAFYLRSMYHVRPLMPLENTSQDGSNLVDLLSWIWVHMEKWGATIPDGTST